MIEIKNLSKMYGPNVGVDDISLNVKKGEILGFLGPNGAGKSTTMNIITGYISSTKGTAKIDGIDILEEPEKAKAKIGYLPEKPPLYYDMTSIEYLKFVFDLKNCKLDMKSHLDEIMDLLKIQNVKNRLIKNLSKGYKQRVGLAQALIGNPEVLILDEPTVGLDPKQIIEIRNLIKDLGKNHTVILSSHILHEVSAICERVIIISNGKIVAEDTPDDLSKRLTGQSKIKVRISGDKNKIIKHIKEIDGIKSVDAGESLEENSYDYIIEAKSDLDIRKSLFYKLADHSYPILLMQPLSLSLENIFKQLKKQSKTVE